MLRLASTVKGAIAEDDGEIQVTPLHQPILHIASPLDTLYTAGGTVPSPYDDSFMKFDRIAVTGAAAASALNLATIAKGSWEVELYCNFGFSGTTNIGNRSYFAIQDPPGVIVSPFWEFPHFTGNFQTVTARARITLQRDNFTFQIQLGTTIAGDNAYLSTTINVRRVL